ncbi:hypothetical protein [Saccharothrix sp. Mg75]|uniref:hypothetical protein n=1 Tax=Saccharothrix sp. Mg75 TaxID=3445357 RepID=UPI003EED0A5D
MTHHIALLRYSRQPLDAPSAVMRVDGDREEVFDVGQGWVRADPRYREWFLSARISEAEAERLVVGIGPPPPLDEEHDPRNTERRALAIEGYGDPYLYFAVETEEHPFDDPLTVVQENLAGEREVLSFTRDLAWRRCPVEGRLVSITKEDVERFKDVQARRVFGDVRVRHFAVVNHVRPDLDDPYLLLREWVDDVDQYGSHFCERYDENREWVRAGYGARHGRAVTGEALDHLLTSWTPHPAGVESRHFAFLDDTGEPLRVARVTADEHGCTTEKSFVTYWREPSYGENCVLEGAGTRVDVDEARAAEFVEVLEHLDRGPEDGRFLYWECLKPMFLGLRHTTVKRFARTWGGDDGLLHAEWFFEREDLWYLSQEPGEVREMEHRPVVPAETEELRRSSLDRRSRN